MRHPRDDEEELKRMKVAKNREDPFKKDIGTNYVDENTYYIQSADDDRIRRDNRSQKIT